MASTWTVEDGKAVWDGRRLADWLPDLTADIAGALDPVGIWVYGSVARGHDDGDSDIDVLVVLDRYDPSAAIELKVQAFRCSSIAAPFDVSFTDLERFETPQGQSRHDRAGSRSRRMLPVPPCLNPPRR